MEVNPCTLDQRFVVENQEPLERPSIISLITEVDSRLSIYLNSHNITTYNWLLSHVM